MVSISNIVLTLWVTFITYRGGKLSFLRSERFILKSSGPLLFGREHEKLNLAPTASDECNP